VSGFEKASFYEQSCAVAFSVMCQEGNAASDQCQLERFAFPRGWRLQFCPNFDAYAHNIPNADVPILQAWLARAGLRRVCFAFDETFEQIGWTKPCLSSRKRLRPLAFPLWAD
jgi:hypothetical protein